MDNRQVAAAFRDAFFWWQRSKESKSEAELDQAAEEGYYLIRKYQSAELVVHMVNDLMKML